MSVTVRVPSPLRRLTDGASQVEVEGQQLRDALDQLEQTHPGFADRLLDDTGELRRFVNVYVRDEDVRHLDGLDTELRDGDVVSIVPAVAGG
jgi:sulfur-carrier protein